MKRRPEAWYRNPFRLGGLGLLFLVTGFTAMSSAVGMGPTSFLYVLGRVGFLIGLVTVLAAGGLWFYDAHRPESPAEDEGETEAEEAER